MAVIGGGAGGQLPPVPVSKFPGLLGLGLGLEAKFSGFGLEASGLGLVFLALALFKANVKVTNILPNTVYLGITL